MKHCETCGAEIYPIERRGNVWYPPCVACEERAIVAAQADDERKAKTAALAAWNKAHPTTLVEWSTTWQGSGQQRTKAEQALSRVAGNIPRYLELLKEPGRQLRIWGVNGVGKTHLAQVLLSNLATEMRCYYISSEVVTRVFLASWERGAHDLKAAWGVIEQAMIDADILCLDELDKWPRGNKADRWLYQMLKMVLDGNIERQGRLIVVANEHPDTLVGRWMNGADAEQVAAASRLGTPAMRREYTYINVDTANLGLLPWQNGGK